LAEGRCEQRGRMLLLPANSTGRSSVTTSRSWSGRTDASRTMWACWSCADAVVSTALPLRTNRRHLARTGPRGCLPAKRKPDLAAGKPISDRWNQARIHKRAVRPGPNERTSR